MEKKEFVHIADKLETAFVGRSLVQLHTTQSTNKKAKTAVSRSPEGSVFVAFQQTAGKGREGRTWESVPGKSLLFSIILKPEGEVEAASLLTHTMSLAVCDVLKNSFGMDVAIKWPNDIFIRGKKAGGILTEIDVRKQKIKSVIVGLGLNIFMQPDDFSPELKGKATSIQIEYPEQIEKISMDDIFAMILNRFENVYMLFKEGKSNLIIDRVRENSFLAGKTVSVKEGNDIEEGKYNTISYDGSLIIEISENKLKKIHSGEIVSWY